MRCWKKFIENPMKRVLLGEHTVTGERFEIRLGETCEIFPIADDMVMAHRDMQDDSHKLAITDAENGWFLRVDGDNYYGNIPMYERISIHPPEPVEFFNIDGRGQVPRVLDLGAYQRAKRQTVLPTLRVILPREMADNIYPDDEAALVDVRSFGVRMPPST